MKAVISVGSNIHPEENIIRGFILMKRAAPVLRVSTFHWTAPVGKDSGTEMYINGLWEVETDDSREDLRARLKEIEDRTGRDRNPENPNAPRTLDLDLLVWNNDILEPEEVAERFFLLTTLRELRPDLVLEGKAVEEVFRIQEKTDGKSMRPHVELTGQMRGELT
jgi:2-amino-4-hydroxy-6-hydroxymethyldihydropteridine diphosphokinase